MAASTFRALNFPPLYFPCHSIHPSKKFYPIRFILFPLTRSSKTHLIIKTFNSLTNPSIDSISPDDSVSTDSNDSVSPSGFDLVSTTEHSDGSVIFKFRNAAEIITDTVVSEESEEMPRNDSILVSSETGIVDDVDNNGVESILLDEPSYDSVEGDMEKTEGETRGVISSVDVDQIQEEEAGNFTRVLGEDDLREEDSSRFNSTEIVEVVEEVSPQLQEESVGTGLELSYDSVEGDIEKNSSDVTEVNGSVGVVKIKEEEVNDFTGVLGEDDPSEEDASRLNSTEIVEIVEEVSPQLREENVGEVISESLGTVLEASYDSVERDIEKKSSDVMEVNGSVDVDRTKEKEPNEFTGVLGEDDPSMDASRRFSSTELVEVVGETSLHALENHDGRSTLESSKTMEDIVSLPEFHTENNDQATNTILEMTDSKQIGSQDVKTSFDINSEEKEMSRLSLTISSGATMLPHPSKALTGGEDAYFIACQNWFGVADGAGQWSLEGNNAGIYARELMENSAKVVSENERDAITDPAELLVRSAAVSTSSGSSTALVAHFTGKALHVANLGDSGFIVIRDGAIFMKSRPMFYGFNFPVQIAKGLDPSQFIESYTVDTAEGDIIICATDALFDNLYENEIALIVSKSLESGSEPKEIAEHLAAITQEVAKSNGVRSPFADAAQAAGYSGISGGKLDDVTVIVSLVHN